MEEYIYTVEEMTQKVAEYRKNEKIIAEYKKAEDIETITEEDMTNIFGSTYFDVHVYWYPRRWYGNHVYTYLTDFEQYEIDNGYDPIRGEYIDELDRQENEHWIEEFESLHTLEDNYPCAVIDVDDFIFELICKLKEHLLQIKTGVNQNDKRDNTATILKYENWIGILKSIDGFITPQELDVLTECVGNYGESFPYDRRNEIWRNMWNQLSLFDIDLLEFESKLYRLDVHVLYELSEVLLEFRDQFCCISNSDNSSQSASGKHNWPISTFCFLWETEDFDSIQLDEVQAEIS